MAPLDPASPNCEVMELDACLSVLQVGTFTILRRVGRDYVAYVFVDSSCSNLLLSKPLSGSKCTSVSSVG